MKKPKKKQAKEQEPLQQGQILCNGCSSRRIQLVYLVQAEELTTLSCLCLNCGNLFPLTFGGVLLMEKELNLVAIDKVLGKE